MLRSSQNRSPSLRYPSTPLQVQEHSQCCGELSWNRFLPGKSRNSQVVFLAWSSAKHQGKEDQGQRFEESLAKQVDLFSKPFEGRQTGGFQTGGFPDLDLSFLFCPFLSFLGLSRFFRDFPRFTRGWSGDFPDSSLLSFSAYYLRAPTRNRVRDTIWTFLKKSGNTRVWKHPGLASLKPFHKPLKVANAFQQDSGAPFRWLLGYSPSFVLSYGDRGRFRCLVSRGRCELGPWPNPKAASG